VKWGQCDNVHCRNLESLMSAEGHQLPLAELVEHFRFAPISGPYLKLIDWPKGATSRHKPVIYSITSSARKTRKEGSATPICFAVRVLRTSSNLVGCSTGKSLALEPFRILST
jgi:hypothetical protein